MISLLRLIAKVCGKLIGILARIQTRALTQAQFLGWVPTDLEARRLLKRQSELFKYDMAKIEMKRRRL